MTKLNIVALSSYGSEFLPIFLSEMAEQGISVVAVLLDGVVEGRERQIQEERTKGFFEWPDFSEIEKYKLPLYCVKNHNNQYAEDLLKDLSPDILINAGTPRILKKNILSIPKIGIVNVHPGYLPDYQGCTVPEWAIYNDDPIGLTCHFMQEGIDTGPVIFSKGMEVKKGEPYESVRAKIIYETAKTMALGLKMIEDNNISIDILPAQPEGTYYKVMTPEKIEEVKKKLLEGRYLHSV